MDDDRALGGRAGGGEGELGAAGGDHREAEGGVGEAEVAHLAAGEQRQAFGAGLGADEGDVAAVEEGVGGAAEEPLRVAEVGALGGQLVDRGRLARRGADVRLGARPADRPGDPVEVPEAVAVGDEVQPPVAVPRRREDRLASPAGDQARRAPRSLRTLRPTYVTHRVTKVGASDPELGPVPGHVGVVPAGPADRRAVGGEAREGVEVAAGGDHSRLGRAVDRQRHHLVLRFAVGAVDLAHADDGGAVGRGVHVGIAQRRRALGRRRDRLRLAAQRQPVEAAVGEVGVDDDVGRGEGPGAAAVLVDPGADVGARRRHLFRRAALGPAHQCRAPALGRPSLGPPDGAVGGDRAPPSRRPPRATWAGSIGERQEP